MGFQPSNLTDSGDEPGYENEITSYLDASMVYGSSEDQHGNDDLFGDDGRDILRGGDGDDLNHGALVFLDA